LRGFLIAHGQDPGPTQRPTTAGALCGILAPAAALPPLAHFGSLQVEAEILNLSEASTIGIGLLVMSLAGAGYGLLFRRAANDPHGGWLFGMAYGFFLWAAGAVMILPLVSGGSVPAGRAAIGILLALLAWGTVLGALFPAIHRRLHVTAGSFRELEQVGPAIATTSAAFLDRLGRPST
jgi:hypothetical protein